MKTFLLASLALISLQGCGTFDSAAGKPRVFSFDFSSLSSAVLQPASDKSDTACMAKADYDACLFAKNPVAVSKTALSGTVIGNNYDTTQVYGVKLTGLTSTTRFENETFRIDALKSPLLSPSVSASAQTLKLKAQNQTGAGFSQLMAYYWLNRTAEYLAGHTGYLPAAGKSIRVVVDDLFSGYSSRANSIHLKGGDNPAAWSPELAIHYFGLANLHFANGGATDTPSTATHSDCGLSAAGCCKTYLGCSRAIGSGVGDYFVAMMFPDQPVLGETVGNSPDGLNQCGLTRNLTVSAKRTAKAAFDACASGPTAGATGARPGDATALGHVYASIWWEVRKAAARQSEKGLIEIDALFMNHLSDLNGSDDFRSALAKIRILDTNVFSGRHNSLFEAEFAARGL